MKLTDSLNSELMELISEFSDSIMRYKLIGRNSGSTVIDEEDGNIVSYTELAQDTYSEIYDQVEEIVYNILKINKNN